jgi:hypothetical protein
MIKKLSFLFTLFSVFLVFMGSIAFADTKYLGYVGTSTVGQCTSYVYANIHSPNDYWELIKIGGNGTATLEMYTSSGSKIGEQSFTFTSTNWNATRTFSSTNVYSLRLCLDSGEEAFFMYGESSIPQTAIFDYTEPSFDPPGGEDPPGGDDDIDPCDGYLGDINPDCDPPGGGDDPPPGGGDDDPPPSDGGGGGLQCNVCEMFECPHWDEYMGKINEIIDGFPTIEDAIGRQTRDLEDAIDNQTDRIIYDGIGTPPSLPSVPSQPSPVDTHDFENDAPRMIENPDLDNSGYNLQDLKNNAPEIEFREDPTGGFDIVNPIDALPDPPDKFPIPGETESDWDENKPADNTLSPPTGPDVEYPTPPQPEVDEIGPPTPGEPVGEVPIPSTQTPIEGSYKYKTHPDNPDGV